MAGISLVVELDDNGTPKLRMLDDVLGELGQKTTKTANAWKRSFDRMSNSVSHLATKMKNVSTSIPAMLGYAGMGAALGVIVKKGIEFNAQLETTETQLGVMVKDTERARNMMKELVQFANKTPYAIRGVAEAAKTLEGAGIGGTEMLRRVGDAAAFSGQGIEDIAGYMGRIASGNYGEAFQRFAELAIATRPMLEAQGLKFDAGGAYVGSVADAMEAVNTIIDTRFGGMMEKLSGTWAGKVSTLGDSINAAFANFTGPIFNVLRNRIDGVIAAFDRMANSQAIRNLGELVARGVDKAAAALTRLMDNPDRFANTLLKVGQWIGAIARGAWGIGKGVGAGIGWAWNILKAFVDWAPLAWTRMLAVMADKIEEWRGKVRGFFVEVVGDIADAILGGLAAGGGPFAPFLTAARVAVAANFAALANEARDFTSALAAANMGTALLFGASLDEIVGERKTALYEAFKAPGFLSTLLGEIEQAKQGLAELPKAGANPMWGGPTGVGLDKPTTGGAPTAPAADPLLGRARELHGEWLQISNERFANDLRLSAQLDQIWTGYWERQDALAMNWLSDSVTSAILEKGQDLKDSLDQIWQSMKASFIRNTIDMGIAWIRSKVAMAKSDQKYGAKEIAARAAYAVASAAAAKAEGSTAAAAAAAKYHSAHAFIPFAGAAIASGFIAKMTGDIQAAGKAAAFRTGTSFVNGAAGAGDVVPAYLEPGEAVIPASRVRQYGAGVIDALRGGTLGGGGDVFAPTITITGAGDARAARRLVMDELVPELERLYRQRRLEFGR